MNSKYWIVGLGGAAGAVLRYGVNVNLTIHIIPFSTILVNLVGSFLLAVLTFSIVKKESTWQLFFGTGLCGGFTTMSTFALETMTLMDQHEWMAVLIYITLNLAGGILMALIGYKLVNKESIL